MGEGRGHGVDDDLAHFVAAGADARADGGQQLGRVAAELRLHGPHQRPRQVGHRPLPTGVAQTDGAMNGVVEQDGRAVGETHGQDAAGLVGDEAVNVVNPGAVLGRRHAGDGRAVHQVGVDDSVGVAAEEAVGATPVGVDALALVGHGHAQVERVERRNADPAAAREDGVAQVAVGQPVEAEGEQVVV